MQMCLGKEYKLHPKPAVKLYREYCRDVRCLTKGFSDIKNIDAVLVYLHRLYARIYQSSLLGHKCNDTRKESPLQYLLMNKKPQKSIKRMCVTL